jgi:hypothetical protein
MLKFSWLGNKLFWSLKQSQVFVIRQHWIDFHQSKSNLELSRHEVHVTSRHVAEVHVTSQNWRHVKKSLSVSEKMRQQIQSDFFSLFVALLSISEIFCFEQKVVCLLNFQKVLSYFNFNRHCRQMLGLV